MTVFQRGHLASRRTRSRARRRCSWALIELMEDRCVPAVITVTSLADGPGNPALVTPMGQGFSAPSLRAAISYANTTGDADTIDLATPGVYQITRPNTTATGEDQNQTGDFDILASGGDLTITNTSGGPVTVSGNGLDRVFDINPNLNFNPASPTPKFTVTMQGFTITGGNAYSANFTDGAGDPGTGNNPFDVTGGAIRDSFNASLTLQNMTISGNTAQAAGGGVTMENPLGFSTPWTLKVVNSTISNNRSGDAGGGINTMGAGRVEIMQSVINNNVCVNQGAGIWLDTVDTNNGTVHNSAVLTVMQSDISGNVSLAADNFGGGIGNAGNDTLASGQTPLPGEVQAVSIIASTVSDNVTAGSGGGYGDQGGQGTLIVQNSTIANNSANDGGGIQADGPSTTILDSTITGNSSNTNGGGVEVAAGTLTLDNSIVAGNHAGAANFVGGMAPDILGTVASGTGNVIGVADAMVTFSMPGSNQVGTLAAPVLAQLGPLQNNGGSLAGASGSTETVPTEAPIAGSPAIDRGVNLASLPATDERGLLRIVGGTVDAGADEYQPPATSTLLSTSGPVVFGTPLTLTAMVAAQTTGNPVTGTVTFSLDAMPLGTGTISNGKATLTITPTLATFVPGSHVLTAAYGGDANFTLSMATQNVTAPLAATMTTLSVSSPIAYGSPVTITATVAGPVAGTTPTGTVTFSIDGVAQMPVTLSGGMATFSFTPTVATFKPVNHTVTVAYSGSTTFASSTSAPTTIAPTLATLTTKLTAKRNRFMLQVFNNGQSLQSFTLNSQPFVQMRDFNGDGINDLVINIKRGRRFMAVAVFSGVNAARLV
jgi:hypothetical protein